MRALAVLTAAFLAGCMAARCDRMHFDVDKFPKIYEYDIRWNGLLDNHIHTEHSEDVSSIKWARRTQRLTHNTPGAQPSIAGFPLYWFLGIDGMKAGTFDGGVHLGLKSTLRMLDDGGCLTRIEGGLSLDDGGTKYISLGANQFQIDAAIDLPNIAAWFDSFGAPLHDVSARLRWDSFGVGGGATVPISLNSFRIDVNVGFVYLDVYVSGSIWVGMPEPPLYIEAYAAGRWWRIPLKFLPII